MVYGQIKGKKIPTEDHQILFQILLWKRIATKVA
jgi:hypothetical protein